MHATICTERLRAAQHALSVMTSHRVWELTHKTGCLLRAEYDAGLLTVEVTSGPPGLEPEDCWDPDDYEEALAETEHDLARRGLLRTAVSDAAAALRELRLLADAADIREIV